MKVGVYVGSFDPVHKGHEKIVDYLLSNNYLDKIIVIPTKDYWDKNDLLSLDIRETMLKIAFKEKATILTSLSKYSYTYQIINELRKEYDNLYLIIGADNMVNFDKWKNVEDILKSNVLVLNRNDIDVNEYVNRFKEKDKFIIISDYPPIDISSTYIRDMIKERKYENVKNYINESVLKYIIENNLYL